MDARFEQAAKTGDAEAVGALLAEGIDVDSRDRFGQTALMLAAVHGHEATVRLLIEAAADLDMTAKYGLSATMLAVVNHHEGVARALAEAGADLALTGTGAPGFAGRTAQDLAAERGLADLAHGLAP